MQWSLINREPRTGVTLFWIDEGMDTGPVFLKKEIAIPNGIDAFELKKLLISLGVEGLKEGLELIRQGKIERKPQEVTFTFAPPIKKEQGQADWKCPAVEIDALIRALAEWPGVATRFATGPLAGQTLKFLKAEALETQPQEAGACPASAVPGEITGIVRGKGFVVKCGQGFLLSSIVQVQGRKPVPAWAFWQGARMQVGDRLGS